MKNIPLKQAIGAFSLLAMSCVGNAHPSVSSGFYGHLSGGALQTLAKLNLNTQAAYQDIIFVPLFGRPLNISQEERVWENNFVGELSLGFAQIVNNKWQIAGEVYLHGSNSRATLDHVTTSPTHNSPNLTSYSLMSTATAQLRDWEYGFDIVPGLRLDDVNLFYGRVGIAFNRQTLSFDSTLSTNLIIDPALFSGTVFASDTDCKSKLGLRVGLGAQRYLCPRLALTADYIFTYYGATDTSGMARELTGIPALLGGVDEVAISLASQYRTQSLMLGLKYYFA